MADHLLGPNGQERYDNLTSYAARLKLDRRTVLSLIERGLIRPAAMIGSTGELLFDGRSLSHDLEVANAIRRQR